MIHIYVKERLKVKPINKFKNKEIVRGKIVDISNDGNGILKLDGYPVVFIPETVTDDEVIAEIVYTSKKFAKAELIEIISPSQYRIPPDCEYSQICGGCSFRHFSYEYELELKKNFVSQNVRRIGNIDTEVSDIVKCDDFHRYRNKAIFQVEKDENDEIKIGFFAENSHKVIDIKDCLLLPKKFLEIVEFIKNLIKKENIEVYDKKTNKGILKQIYLRETKNCKEIMVCFVIVGKKLQNSKYIIRDLIEKFPEIKQIAINHHKKNTFTTSLSSYTTIIYGEDLTDTLLSKKYVISPNSFYQVNSNQTEILYSSAISMINLDGTDTVLDLYCGIGSIGLSLVDNIKKLIGIDIVESSIENAKMNAKLNNIENAIFYCEDAKNISQILKTQNEKIDIVIFDPPRKGADKELLSSILEISPNQILMISCDSATAARDAKFLNENGYKAKKIVPVDMFPRTTHVETIIILDKIQIKG